ncbi:MAG: TolC family protein [Gemmatimonadetes bacterium]|nr:TolC family protein [Gemmatimonadota bacterium]
MSGARRRAVRPAPRLTPLLSAALLAAVAASPGGAATQEPDTLTLTLERALDVALGSNPAYRQAVNRSRLNGAEWRRAWFDQVLPRAQLNLFSTQFTGNLTRRAVDNFGNPIERPVTDWNYFSQTNQALDLTWAIQGSSLFNAVDRQRLVNQDRDVAERRALLGMEVGVKSAFWDALEQAELLRTEEELVQARRTDLEVAQRLFGLAMRTRVDVLSAELAVEQQQRALRQQEAAYEKATLALRTRMGDEALPAFRLADTPLPLFAPSTLDAEALVAAALDVNPELRQAEVAVRAASVSLRDSKRAWWPTLLLNFNVARRAQTAQGDALFDFSWNESLDQRFYVGLQMPMFNNYFQNQAEISQSSVELSNRREAERETRLRVGETVRGALLELRSQWESLRLAERSGQIAGEALRLSQEEYRIGTRTFGELRQAMDAEAETRRQVIRARYSFVSALLSLEEAVGDDVTSLAAMGR